MNIRDKLLNIYEDEEKAEAFENLLEVKLKDYEEKTNSVDGLTEKDVMLITYGDSIISDKTNNIKNLENILDKYVGDLISAIHILPMYPYTSDDGFSVVDYKKINKNIGKWEDIINISKKYDLMYDAVINHISSESMWFKECINGNEKYKDYFIQYDENFDYSNVTRPRVTPLFTEFQTSDGLKKYWTTFSDDQIDLNFENIDLATDIVELMIYYAVNGAKFIRLDAIGFLWRESGTTCMHLDKTHEMIKVIRDVLDVYSPKTKIITETNVPHEFNVSYFGNGGDEAQLVYQFPLPPLTIFSFLTGDASKLSNWADSLGDLNEKTTYFNFLASHDGIGLRPTEGILNDSEREFLAKNTLKNGGKVNYKSNVDGSISPYELNINYQDALSGQYESDEIRIKKFIGSQVILLSVVGMPAIYIHSLLGSRNDFYGVETTGINRKINREQLNYNKLDDELSSNSFRKEILDKILRVIKIRKNESAFATFAKQEVLFLDKRVFAIKRINKKSNEEITVLVNVSKDFVKLDIELIGIDLFTGIKINNSLELKPLEFMWIK